MYEHPFSPEFEYIAAMIFDHMGIEYTPPYLENQSEKQFQETLI